MTALTREAVARIVDPDAWRESDGINDSRAHPILGQGLCQKLEAPSLAKADAILALAAQPDPELEALRGLSDRGVGGPWKTEDIHWEMQNIVCAGYDCGSIAEQCEPEDAALICAAVNYIRRELERTKR